MSLACREVRHAKIIYDQRGKDEALLLPRYYEMNIV